MTHKAAAQVFLELTPEYIVCPENAKILEKEIVKLVDREGFDPADVATYRKAFCRVADQLKLNEIREQKPLEEFSGEELSKLSTAEKDRLSTPLTKRLADFEFQQSRLKPEVTQEQQWARAEFEDADAAYSPANCRIVTDWLKSNGLALTPQNIRVAIIQVGEQLAPSEAYLNSLSADRYRKEVVEPEFRKQRASERKPESKLPFGIKSYADWLHSS